jgi:hypothetical protein
LSSETCTFLGLSEVIVDLHLVAAIYNRGHCECVMPNYLFSIPVECDLNLRRCSYTPVGHSPLLSSFSACKSSLRLLSLAHHHHVIFILESQYGTTNELFHGFPSAHGSLALQLICIVCCVYKLPVCIPCSHFPCFHLRRFDPGTVFLPESSL